MMSTSIRSGDVERDCAARYLHSWAIALRDGETDKGALRVIARMFQFARDIRAGCHVSDPDGAGPAAARVGRG